MKQIRSILLCLAVLPFLFGKCGTAEPIAGNGCKLDPGFKEGYISAASIDGLLRTGAEYIRVYTIRPDRGTGDDGSIMVIGTDRDHRELTTDQGGKRYIVYQSIFDDEIVMVDASEPEACRYLFNMMFSGKSGCTADIHRDRLRELMERGPDAIKVEPMDLNDRLTLSYTPVRVGNGEIEQVGASFLAENPCPYDCGHYTTFACLARDQR